MKTWSKRFWAVVQLAAAVSGGSVCVNVMLASPARPANPPAQVAQVTPSCTTNHATAIAYTTRTTSSCSGGR